MYWNHSFQFWWLIPVLMILICFFMCFVMRRRGMAGCCMTWRGSRNRWRDLPTDGGEDRPPTSDPFTSMEDKTQTESLKAIIEGLERRLSDMEGAVRR